MVAASLGVMGSLATDPDRRLDDRERKLDRVRKAPEMLNEDAMSGQLKGDNGPGKPAKR